MAGPGDDQLGLGLGLGPDPSNVNVESAGLSQLGLGPLAGGDSVASMTQGGPGPGPGTGVNPPTSLYGNSGKVLAGAAGGSAFAQQFGHHDNRRARMAGSEVASVGSLAAEQGSTMFRKGAVSGVVLERQQQQQLLVQQQQQQQMLRQKMQGNGPVDGSQEKLLKDLFPGWFTN